MTTITTHRLGPEVIRIDLPSERVKGVPTEEIITSLTAILDEVGLNPLGLIISRAAKVSSGNGPLMTTDTDAPMEFTPIQRLIRDAELIDATRATGRERAEPEDSTDSQIFLF